MSQLRPNPDASLLIVDDDPDAIQVLRRALRAHTDVRFATRGEDALRRLEERACDLLLLDAEMPGMGGLEVCRALKAHPRLGHIPVVFVSAHDDPHFEREALDAGAVDFLTKPISPARAQLRVAIHLTLKQQADALRLGATTDPLTQLANRRELDRVLQREWERARRSAQPLSLLLVELESLDDFRSARGGPAANEALLQAATSLAAAARRPADVPARIGAALFALLLPETGRPGAEAVARELRARLARPRASGEQPAADGPAIRVGLAVDPAGMGETGASAESLFDRADVALRDVDRTDEAIQLTRAAIADVENSAR